MEKKVIKIKGLDCANCARELEEELNEKIGVKASVDFINQQVKLEFNTKDELEKAKYAISHFEEVQIVETESSKKIMVLYIQSHLMLLRLKIQA